MAGIFEGLVRVTLLLPFLLGLLALFRWLAMDPPPRKARSRSGHKLDPGFWL